MRQSKNKIVRWLNREPIGGIQTYNWSGEEFQKIEREGIIITEFFSNIKDGEIDEVKKAIEEKYKNPVHIDLDKEYDLYGSTLILGPSLVWAIKYNQPAIAKLLLQNGANMFKVVDFGGEQNGYKTMAIYDYVKRLPLREEYMGLKRAFESEFKRAFEIEKEAKIINAINKLKKKSIMLLPLEKEIREEALRRINLEEKPKRNELALRAAQAAEAKQRKMDQYSAEKAKHFYKAIQESDQSTIQHSINTEYINIDEKYIVEGYPQGVSPLTYAIHINNPKSAEILLRLGADPCEVIPVDFEGNIGVRQITLHDLVKTFGPDRRGVKELFSQVEPCKFATFTVTGRNASAGNVPNAATNAAIDMIIGNAPNAPVIAAPNGAAANAATAGSAIGAGAGQQAPPEEQRGFFSGMRGYFGLGGKKTRKHTKKSKKSKRHSRRNY